MGVYKRGNTWQAIVRIKGHETVCHTFDTKGQAEEWHEETRFEIRRGRYSSRKEVENTTLAEVLDRYEREILPSKKARDLSTLSSDNGYPILWQNVLSFLFVDRTLPHGGMIGSKLFLQTLFVWAWPPYLIFSRSRPKSGG